jgi:transcriptional regulator NrdR family protein|tara:strand:- start:68 stop:277 length:210 start_codon:yes stop_codon:yes gene_type:complete
MRKRVSFVSCPECKIYTFQKVLVTRVHDDLRTWRRRECEECHHRWCTIQQPEESVDNITEADFLKQEVN